MNRILNIFLSLSLLVLMASGGNSAFAAAAGQNGGLSVKICDSGKNPISGAKATVLGKGTSSLSDSKGTVVIAADGDDYVTVEKEGYFPVTVTFRSLSLDPRVMLLNDVLKGDENKVVLPYASMDKFYSTGSANTVTGEDLNHYPTNDLRIALLGVLPGLESREFHGAPGMFYTLDGEKAGLTGRTNHSPIFIVDNVPVYITQLQLDPEEIESVTYVKDVADAMLYGPRACTGGGAVYIKTKHGARNTRSIKVNFEKGVGIVDRFPEYVNGLEYAQLNNTARIADGLTPLYDVEALRGYAKNDPLDKRYPNVDWRSMMFKDTKSFTKANFAVNGGGKTVLYHAGVNYAGEGDIYNIGAKADFNRLNVHTNVDVNITKYLKAGVSFYGGLSIRRSPVYGNNTSTYIMMTEVLSALRSIPNIAFPLYLDKTGDITTYAVNSQWANNPYADLTERGFYNELTRTGMTNITVDYDFASIVPGLKSQTFFNINVFNQTRKGQNPDYLANIYYPETGETVITGHEGTKVSAMSRFAWYYYQSLNFYERLSYDYAKNHHKLGASLTYDLQNTVRTGVATYQRQQNLIANVNYSYRDKYLVNLVGDYSGSSRFKEGNRYNFFPAAGLGWVISEENFMKNSKTFDYLKLRVQGGVAAYENFGTQYLYEDSYTKASGLTFGPASANQWFGSNKYSSTITQLNRLGNPDLTWEKHAEVDLGIDALLFKRKLSVEYTYYWRNHYDVLTEMTGTLPYIYGLDGVVTYDNYNSYTYYGHEIALRFTDTKGDFTYSIGAWAIAGQGGKYKKCNETDPTYEYQRITGRDYGYIAGYEYIGKFTSDADVNSSYRQMFDDRNYVGDLKYADLNGDKVIDSNDQKVIGNSLPKLIYNVSLYLKYRNWDLTVVGSGRAKFDVNLLNSSYYNNGWGVSNYSAFVRDNVGGAYPRLTYNKVNGNFATSRYWLRDGSYFKLQNVELGYDVPLPGGNKIGIKGLRVYARGANLFTVSGIKDVDPESLNSGVTHYPLFRTITGGVKFTF